MASAQPQVTTPESHVAPLEPALSQSSITPSQVYPSPQHMQLQFQSQPQQQEQLQQQHPQSQSPVSSSPIQQQQQLQQVSNVGQLQTPVSTQPYQLLDQIESTMANLSIQAQAPSQPHPSPPHQHQQEPASNTSVSKELPPLPQPTSEVPSQSPITVEDGGGSKLHREPSISVHEVHLVLSHIPAPGPVLAHNNAQPLSPTTQSPTFVMGPPASHTASSGTPPETPATTPGYPMTGQAPIQGVQSFQQQPQYQPQQYQQFQQQQQQVYGPGVTRTQSTYLPQTNYVPQTSYVPPSRYTHPPPQQLQSRPSIHQGQQLIQQQLPPQQASHPYQTGNQPPAPLVIQQQHSQLGQLPSPQAGQLPSPQPGQLPSPQPGQLPSPQPGQLPSPQPGQLPSPQPGQQPSPQPGQQLSPQQIQQILPQGYQLPPLQAQIPQQGQQPIQYYQNTQQPYQQPPPVQGSQPQHTYQPTYQSQQPFQQVSQQFHQGQTQYVQGQPPAQYRQTSQPSLPPSPSAIVPSLGIPSPTHQSGNSETPNVATTSSPPFPPTSNGTLVSTPSFMAAAIERTTSPSRMSQAFDENRAQHVQHLRGGSMGQTPNFVTGHGSGRASPLPRVNSGGSGGGGGSGERPKPIPTKSEDWAALVDTPASPTLSFANRPFSMQAPFMMNNGYTDSPSEEVSVSSDYMQHISQQQQQQHRQSMPYVSAQQQQYPGSRPHAQTDPTSVHRHLYHQHHNSISNIPMAGPGDQGFAAAANNNLGVNPGARHAHRNSWSPNNFESIEGPQPGFRTPPRRHDSPGPGSSRSGSHSKQNSVATSQSLLNDTAVVAKYREAAIRTNDTTVQLSYAKYLLDIGESSETYSAAAVPEAASSSSSGANTAASIANPPDVPIAGGAPTSTNPGGASDPESTGKRQLTQEAIYWIDRLSKEGQPEAQYIRGTWYEDGLYGIKKNADKALRNYQSASKGDYSPAHYKVASFCEKRKDNSKAVVLYKKATAQNDVPSNYRLALVYLYGELGQSKNMKTGLQYLKRAASLATVEMPTPAYVLGLILAREYKQLNIPDDIAFPDDGEAFEMFKKAAELGHGPANFKIGYCYEYGTLGCLIDPFQSIKHYERAAYAGGGNGEAEMALSGWHLSGAENLFEPDDASAFRYASLAAEKQLPKAQYAMGYYYEVGISVPADLIKAMEYYRQAAANGNKDAQNRLADQSKFDRSGHKNSIRRIKQGRNAKDQNCIVM